MNAAFDFFPLLPRGYYALLIVLAILAAVIAWRRGLHDLYWRGSFCLLLLVLLLNPVLMHELREGLPDKLLIVVDRSASQKIGGRDVVADKALAHIKAQIAAMQGIEPVVIEAGTEVPPGKGESTNLFGALRDSLLSVPLAQVAGTVLITDGEVHDVPPALGVLEKLQPFHVVLTGKKDEFDRKVSIVSAPKYGVLNDQVTISVRVDEFGSRKAEALTLTALQDGQRQSEAVIMPGQVLDFVFNLTHPGQNVFEFSVPADAGELTASNNTAPVIINGIRDRLKVLLVSGSPHMGERSWRNLLKSDPAIDLVHFTILRSPSAMDPTPQNELSLIVFPVDELFQKKIKDFDLIIFDRYQSYSLLQPQYFTNIAEFVRNGGAFLVAMSTDQPDSGLLNTMLNDLLPVTPAPQAQGILKQAYRPALTEAGKIHPVTAGLDKAYAQRKWGEWFAQSEVTANRGQTLMTGIDGKPLLVLDKAGDGRVAVLASDNIWLWSKGAEQAGPYSDLLRNVSHWLMKEPELEDDFIRADARGNVITVAQRAPDDKPRQVTMTAPSGEKSEMTLTTAQTGWMTGTVTAAQNGVYSFGSGEKKAFIVIGTALNEEFSDVHTTPEKLQPVVDATRGGIIWFQDEPDFAVRRVNGGGKAGGDDWIGLRRNDAYAVTKTESRTLVPDSAALLLLLSAILFVWRREGGKK